MKKYLPLTAALILTCTIQNVSADTTATEATPGAAVEAAPAASPPEAPNPADVLIRVNGEDVTRGEIMQVMSRGMQQMAGRVPPEQLQQMQEQMYGQIKEDMISRMLIDAAVAEANIDISDETVAQQIEEIKTSVPEGQTLESALAAQGMSMEDLTKDIKAEMATRQFLESKVADIAAATEADATEYYEKNPTDFEQPAQVSASHILLSFEGEESDEDKTAKKASLIEIRDSIVAEEITFEDAATEHSDCPSKAQGGSLGSFSKGQMVPEFEAAAFSQEIDTVGNVVETQFGYHIIKVSERNDGGKMTFEEVKEQLTVYLSQQKKQEAVAAFVARLRANATIEVFEI